MNKRTRWLRAKIAEWSSQGIITPVQAAQLQARYAAEARAETPWGLLVFATAGSIVIALGVILLFAYNWDEIPKFGKLGLVFAGVMAAHTAGIRLLGQETWKPKLGEAMLVLGTMLYGSGIWLVAQVYHIEEHYPNGFLWWALGALAMAWAARSTANGLVAIVLTVIWGASEAMEFHRSELGSLLLVIAGILPLAWLNRSALLLGFALAGVQVLLLATTLSGASGAHALTGTLALGMLLVAASRLADADEPRMHGGAPVIAVFGFGSFLICAYILSFDQGTQGMLNWDRAFETPAMGVVIFGWLVFIAGIASWARLGFLRCTGKITLPREDWLIPIAAVYAFGIAALNVTGLAEFVSWAFSLMLLGLAAMWMWRGCRQSRLAPTILGSIILAAVALGRYFDLFHSLAARGLAFIVLGAVFIIEAMYYRRMRREAEDAS